LVACPRERVDRQVEEQIVRDEDHVAMRIQLGPDGSEQVRRQRARNRLQRRHVPAVRVRSVVGPRQRRLLGAPDVRAVLVDRRVELALRDRLGLHLKPAAGRDDEQVERVGRREVLHGHRLGGQPARELRDGLGVDRLLVDEHVLVLRVFREERLHLREVLRLGLRQQRRQVLDTVELSFRGLLRLLRLQRFGEHAQPILLGDDALGGRTRRRVSDLGPGRGERVAGDPALAQLEHRPALAVVAFRRILLVQLQEQPRQLVVRGDPTLALQVLRPRLVFGELGGQRLHRRDGFLVQRQRLAGTSEPLVESSETEREGPTSLRRVDAARDRERALVPGSRAGEGAGRCHQPRDLAEGEGTH
jgi:hypothetical protein